MTPEAREAIRRGTCPSCSKPHNRRLKTCTRCGNTECEPCWKSMGLPGTLCLECEQETAQEQRNMEGRR